MKLILAISFLLIQITGTAQANSVEKSVTGIQVGLLGIWGHGEFKLIIK